MEPVPVARPVKVAPHTDPLTVHMELLMTHAADRMNGSHAAAFHEYATIVRHVYAAERAIHRAWQAIDRALIAIDQL